MSEQRLKHYIVSTEGGDWHCRPTSRRVTFWLAVLFINGLLMSGGGMFLDSRLQNGPQALVGFPNLFGVVGSLTGLLIWGVGVWFFWYRNVPLVIEKTGRIRMGLAVIAEVKNIRQVELRPPSDIEDESGYYFNLRLKDKSPLKLKSPYFSRIGTVDVATELAEEVAKELGVKLIRNF